MNHLIDTNVLLRLRDNTDPRYRECVHAVDLLRARNERLLVCAQVRATFRCLAEPVDMADRWRQTVEKSRAMGKQAHDARLAALMLAHGVGSILTFNGSDFTRYEGITPVSPGAVR